MFNLKKQLGFTLIELLIAIAILALISATGIVVFATAQKAARNAKRAEDLKSIKLGISLYRQQGLALPAEVPFDCISSSLSLLVPKYIPRLPADPLDNGNASGPHCYQYSTANTTNQYKVRTNPSLNNGEMSAQDYARQPAIVDPASDDMQDCLVSSNANSYSGWAVFDGAEICDNTEGEAVAF